MKCVVCGEELAENALLCPRCGSVVRREDVVRQQAASRQLTKKMLAGKQRAMHRSKLRLNRLANARPVINRILLRF